MKRLVFIFVLLLLPGCAASTAPGSDVAIVWNRVDDPQVACEGLAGRREFFKIMGCSKWREASNRRECVIYAPEPRDERDKERFVTLGHEVMHCFEGNWHDRWGRMNEPKSRLARGEHEDASAAAGSTTPQK